MKRLLGVCALVVLAHAADVGAAGWTYGASDHFEVYTTGGEDRARDALRAFERVHAFFESMLRLPPAHGLPTRLVVFSGPKEYAPFRPNEVAPAFYQSGADREHIVLQSLDVNALPIVVHEYAHLMIRRAGAVYPVWLNEGLAEFFSTMAPQGRQMQLGQAPPQRVATLLLNMPAPAGPNKQQALPLDLPALRTSTLATLIPLERLFAIANDSPEYNTASHASMFYAESWALAHLLMVDDRYRPESAAFLSTVSRGTPPSDAFMTIYGKTIAAVTHDLEGYITRGHYGHLQIDYAAPAGESRVVVRPATAFEADVVTATVLGNIVGRERDARTAFEGLARQHADDLALVEARGLFELERGHSDDALPYLARAVALGSRNARLVGDYAAAVAVSDGTRAEALFAQALAFDPDDARTRVELARLLVDTLRSAEALAALAAVKTVPADLAFPFYEAQARAALQAGRDDLAQSAAAAATRSARTPQQVESAEHLEQSIADAALVIRVVEGRLTNMICGAGTPILEVTTAAGLLRVVMDDPGKVKTTGAGAAPAEIACGPQNRPVRIGYLALPDAGRKTDGLARLLNFRNP